MTGEQVQRLSAMIKLRLPEWKGKFQLTPCPLPPPPPPFDLRLVSTFLDAHYIRIPSPHRAIRMQHRIKAIHMHDQFEEYYGKREECKVVPFQLIKVKMEFLKLLEWAYISGVKYYIGLVPKK